MSDASFFVKMHYYDFLNREADTAGLNFWRDQITSCGSDAGCTETRNMIGVKALRRQPVVEGFLRGLSSCLAFSVGKDSVNYKTVAKKVLAHAETAQRQTVEALAADLARICLEEPGVQQVRIRVEKPGAVRFGPTDLAAAARRAAETLAPAATRKGQQLELQLAPTEGPIAANADYLERAIANLLDNAIKYTPSGGRIALVLRQEDDRAIIEVTDSGIGIPAEDLPRIFERFYRVDRSRSREMGGTGLGLSIVKHIVQAHHGSVEVRSTPGEGSTFTIVLPLNG